MAKKPKHEQKERLFEESLVPAKRGSDRLFDVSYGDDESKPVECLGMTFENDQARREYFLEKLREKLKDPEFRKIEGFPIGEDEDILAMSDPPYYTACPNPFLVSFIESEVGEHSDLELYHREPFAIDVNVGKTDQLYKAHGYHTKVPHLAIVPSILHYTEPGDLVVDGFCGSGLSGVAAKWCAVAPKTYRTELETEWEAHGDASPQWGRRFCILNDLSPAATFIATNYTLPFDLAEFAEAGRRLLCDIEHDVAWMYETTHVDGRSKGRINYVVWSEVFSCPDCSGEIVFYEQALDQKTKRVRELVACPHCSAQLKKNALAQRFETLLDPATGETWDRIALKPVLVNYDVGKRTFEKPPDNDDLRLLNEIAALRLPDEVPTNEFPFDDMWEAPRLRSKGLSRIHHLFFPRAAHSLAAMWRRAAHTDRRRLRNMLLYLVEQAIWGMSVMARYAPTHYSQVNQYLSGAYYVGSQIVDVSPWYILDGKLKRLEKAFAPVAKSDRSALTTTGSCSELPIPSSSVDYVFGSSAEFVGSC